ncbi:hypothetical protein CYJ73_24380 [Gordonia terrae]|uniref:Uncharacterized protein n=1 Tax=Gordonia terrae TaxID=2055 RepID=A0A2I1R1G4_9ACTN|nr:hypothetical protein CYJ73_24380 [Gordonia terrae]
MSGQCEESVEGHIDLETTDIGSVSRRITKTCGGRDQIGVEHLADALGRDGGHDCIGADGLAISERDRWRAAVGDLDRDSLCVSSDLAAERRQAACQ